MHLCTCVSVQVYIILQLAVSVSTVLYCSVGGLTLRGRGVDPESPTEFLLMTRISLIHALEILQGSS